MPSLPYNYYHNKAKLLLYFPNYNNKALTNSCEKRFTYSKELFKLKDLYHTYQSLAYNARPGMIVITKQAPLFNLVTLYG